MSTDYTIRLTFWVCLCILGLTPSLSEASLKESYKNEQYKKHELSQQHKDRRDRDQHRPGPSRPDQHSPNKQKRSEHDKSRKDRDQHRPGPFRSDQHSPNKQKRSEHDKSRKDRDQHRPGPSRSDQHSPNKQKRSEYDKSRKDRDRHRPDRHDRSNRDHRTRTKPLQHPRRSHDRHYKRYSLKQRAHRYRHHETYHYHTHYLAPIRRHYQPLGLYLTFIPHDHVRIFVGGLPYFYFGGTFYRHQGYGYIVVRAPIGAVVHTLPVGFIAFYVRDVRYYYVNDIYYIWDEDQAAYVVVNKPRHADDAIAKATDERLMVYPNQGQSEEQQAKDRYECHRWAVRESHVDPTLDEEDGLNQEDRRRYKQAISACLEGRNYTVK